MRSISVGLVFCVACGGEFKNGEVLLHPRGTVAVDPNFNETEFAVIQEAAFWWGYRTDWCVDLKFGRVGFPIFKWDRSSRTFGTTYDFGVIVLDPNRVGLSGLRTVEHEFGHAFGLSHSPHKADIMFTPNTGDAIISDNDVAEFMDVWGEDCP